MDSIEIGEIGNKRQRAFHQVEKWLRREKKKKKKGKLALSLFGRGGYSSGSDSNPFWANWANSIGGMEDSRSIYSVPEFILFLILISNF